MADNQIGILIVYDSGASRLLTMVKRICIYLLLPLLAGLKTSAQKIDSIYFNLYTDSLKKGTYNYINVDGKSSDGRWLPLTAKELKFTASSGTFSGNSLFIDSSTHEEKVSVKVALIKDPSTAKEMVIYIKKNAETERLKTMEEVMQGSSRSSPSGKKKKRSRQ